ncbi:MAG: LemA family protein [Bacilli bacterium]|nr:LemA family protein [Bacilli bacterium]
MNLFTYILLIIIAVCIILIWYISIYNNYQNYIIRMNEAESFIDNTLRKRFDLLNKSIDIIKNVTNTKKDVLNIIKDLKSVKLSNFDLDRKLYEAINEFNGLKEANEELKNNESFLKVDLGLIESEAEIVAARKYYNDIVTDYNKLVRSFPSNIVAKISRYKTKTYFDGKNMEDDDTKDFKL